MTTTGECSSRSLAHQIPFAETSNGRLPPISGPRVSRSSSRTPVAHLVNARSPPSAKFHAAVHAAYSRTGPRDALSACNRFAVSDGSPPECAVTAQIAHSKYTDQYARLVRNRVRTGSRFALLVRNRQGANQAGRLLSIVMVARRWFPLRFPRNAGLLPGNIRTSKII